MPLLLHGFVCIAMLASAAATTCQEAGTCQALEDTNIMLQTPVRHHSHVDEAKLDELDEFSSVIEDADEKDLDAAAAGAHCWFRKPISGAASIDQGACKPSSQYHTFFPAAWTELPKNCYKGYGAAYVGTAHTSWVQGKTLDECKALCLAKSGCTAITFDLNAAAGSAHCWFRKPISGAASIDQGACKPSSQYHTFFPAAWTELPKNCYKGYGAAYVGTAHTSWVRGKTLDECKALCLAKSGCTAITFDLDAAAAAASSLLQEDQKDGN